MVRFTLVACILFLTTALAYSKEYEIQGKTDSYAVTVRFDKNLPVQGKNQTEIEITDRTLKPVTDATVVVQYLMPSLPGRPPMMEYKANATRDGGNYIASVDINMAGEWTFLISITRGGKTEVAKFSFVVR